MKNVQIYSAVQNFAIALMYEIENKIENYVIEYVHRFKRWSIRMIFWFFQVVVFLSLFNTIRDFPIRNYLDIQ